MDLNYYRTLIVVAEDCPVTASEVPPAREGKPTAASVQYQMLAEQPYTFTQEDVLFESWLRRQDFPAEPSEDERAALRDQFFSKPQACLRSSPLPKRYGWGLRFDDEGRVALCPMESPEYQTLTSGGAQAEAITILKAMRSRRG